MKHTVNIRARVQVNASSEEEAGELARLYLMRGWRNMSLGTDDIVIGNNTRDFHIVKSKPTRKNTIDTSDDSEYTRT